MSKNKNTRKVGRDDSVVHEIADLMDSAYLAQSTLEAGDADQAKRIVNEATERFVRKLTFNTKRVTVRHKCEVGHIFVAIDVEDEHGVYEATLKARSTDV